jgi:hypothetical protein
MSLGSRCRRQHRSKSTATLPAPSQTFKRERKERKKLVIGRVQTNSSHSSKSPFFSHLETWEKAIFSQTTQTPLLRSRPLFARIVFANTRRAHSAPRPRNRLQRQHRHRPVNNLRYTFRSLSARARVPLGAGAFSHNTVASFRASACGFRVHGRLVHDGWWGGFHESYKPG